MSLPFFISLSILVSNISTFLSMFFLLSILLLCVSFSFSLFLSVSFSLPLSVSFSLSISICVFSVLFFSLLWLTSLSISFFFSLSLYLCPFSLSFSLFLCLFLNLSFSICVFFFLSLFLNLSFSISFYIFSISLSVFLSHSVFFKLIFCLLLSAAAIASFTFYNSFLTFENWRENEELFGPKNHFRIRI